MPHLHISFTNPAPALSSCPVHHQILQTDAKSYSQSLAPSLVQGPGLFVSVPHFLFSCLKLISACFIDKKKTLYNLFLHLLCILFMLSWSSVPGVTFPVTSLANCTRCSAACSSSTDDIFFINCYLQRHWATYSNTLIFHKSSKRKMWGEILSL